MTKHEEPLAPGTHYELVVATRDALWANNRTHDDVELMVRRFGFDIVGDYQDPDWGSTLIDADQSKLIQLAQYLGTTPHTDDAGEVSTAPIDAYTELVAAETALRDVVRLTIPDWQEQLGEEAVRRLLVKRTEEDKKRDGITVSQDLLDYTEVHQIEGLIEKNWAVVKPVLDDQARAKVYLGIITDVRNTISHSRPVVPSERLLLAGAAGQIRNQLAKYRSSLDGSAMHYSSIDSARDSSGTDGRPNLMEPHYDRSHDDRVDVGDIINFDLAATDPRDRELTWEMYITRNDGAYSYSMSNVRERAKGSRTTLTWEIQRTDVGERIEVVIVLQNASEFQRDDSHDDARVFYYKVNPPLD